MRYEILGTLRVTDGDDVTFISARKIEILLAVLAVRADQVVPIEQLITEIWAERMPSRPTAGLHVYVSHLRKFLSRPGQADSPIVTRPSGYLLRLGSDEIDYQLFVDGMDRGRAELRAGRFEQAVARFDQALGLWRGPILSEPPRSQLLDGFVAWMNESQIECLELQMEARLGMGRHRELVGPLYALIAEHPLRETFYQQLMLAMYRSNRQADALAVYQTARRTLERELGLEPCLELQRMQAAILAADSALLSSATAA